jgi:hypothetical protein
VRKQREELKMLERTTKTETGKELKMWLEGEDNE